MNLRDSTDSDPADILLKATSPGELVTAVPYLLGFHPAESMVAVCLHGPRRRVGLAIRVDLPPADDAVWVRELVGRIGIENAATAVLVCYTDEPDDAAGPARRALVETVRAALAHAGVEVADALLVRAGRWWSYTCSLSCCPPSGTPVPASLAGSVPAFLAAERVGTGRPAVAGSRAEFAASVAGPVAFQLVVAEQAFERGAAAIVAERRRDGPDQVRRRTVERISLAATSFAEGTTELDDAEVARICLGLHDISARDDVLALLASDRPAWISLLTMLASRTPDGFSAPVCTTLAWAAYEDGDGALANVALDRALDDDPDYTMAHLLRAGLDEQVKPSAVRSISDRMRRRRRGPSNDPHPDGPR